jgi:hypothetical protein
MHILVESNHMIKCETACTRMNWTRNCLTYKHGIDLLQIFVNDVNLMEKFQFALRSLGAGSWIFMSTSRSEHCVKPNLCNFQNSKIRSEFEFVLNPHRRWESFRTRYLLSKSHCCMTHVDRNQTKVTPLKRAISRPSNHPTSVFLDSN